KIEPRARPSSGPGRAGSEPRRFRQEFDDRVPGLRLPLRGFARPEFPHDAIAGMSIVDTGPGSRLPLGLGGRVAREGADALLFAATGDALERRVGILATDDPVMRHG